jgi:hypothetical protein
VTVPKGYTASFNTDHWDDGFVILTLSTDERSIKTSISLDVIGKYGVREIIQPTINRMVRCIEHGVMFPAYSSAEEIMQEGK